MARLNRDIFLQDAVTCQEEHRNENLGWYCDDCEMLVCDRCVSRSGGHSNHQRRLLNEVFREYKDQICWSQAQVGKHLNKMESVLKKLHASRDQVLRTINFDLGENSRKTQLMGQVQRLAQGKLEKLEEHEQKLDLLQSRLMNCLDLLDQSLCSDNPVEVVREKCNVLGEFKKLTSLVQSNVVLQSPDTLVAISLMDIKHFNVRVSCSSRTSQLYENVFAYPASTRTTTYSSAIQRLPTAFYYNALTGIILTGENVEQRNFPGSLSIPKDVPLLRRNRRDHFRPPHGPPVHYLISVGYGKEVGLQDGFQELYDPFSQRNIVLDHNTAKIARPNRVQPSKKQMVHHVSISASSVGARQMPAHLCFQPAIIKEAFDRAQSKSIGCTMSFRGQNGHPGVDGTPGMSGALGKNASCFGRHGQSGGHGKRGTKGGRGTNGHCGGNAFLTLKGSADQLVVNGGHEYRVRLGGTQSEQVLLIDCRGGNGGRGGYGGKGGDGGGGGNGSSGAPGKSTNVRGRNGGDGGHGGSGGDGGQGGQGGAAGDGGSGGNGGNCLIQTADPRLLILVEVNCMPGVPGPGAQGGKGGAGGHPGRGGNGGVGGSGGPPVPFSLKSGDTSVTVYQYTTPGRNGSNGSTGNYGRSGDRGLNGKNGQLGQNGGILWVVSAPGMKTQASSTRYDAVVKSLTVTPVLDGGVFEPNERIIVSGVVVHNQGGLDLPEGVSISLCSLYNVNFEPSKFDIPHKVLKAGQKCTIPFQFRGRLYDLSPPNEPGPQSYKAQFHSRIELLGRPFEKSIFMKELLVQYPVQLGNLMSPKTMDRGKVSVISVEVMNLSSLPYGKCKNSGGRVVLQLHLDSRLIPVGKVSSSARDSYVISYDHNVADSTFIELLYLPPKQKVTVNIRVQMENCAELFDKCLWQVDLYLRDKLVEYNHRAIRVVPKYDSQKIPADALLVIDETMTHQKYNFWCYLFHFFDITFDVWDISLYNGLSIDSYTGARHKSSWHGRYHGKLIVYPHCSNLDLLAGGDIAHHFHGTTFREKPLKELNSSLIVFMPSRCSEVKVLRHLARVHPKVEVSRDDYSGSHLSMPSALDKPAPYTNCERKLLKRIEENSLSQAPMLLSRKVNISHMKFFKYSYGHVDIRQVPIMKSSKFLVVGNTHDLDDSIPSFIGDILPLASKQGQTILAFLYGISISSKLKFLKNMSIVPTDFVFYLPNSSILGLEELAMITLAWEVADELFSLSGESRRMAQIYDDVTCNVSAYLKFGQIVLRGLKLIDKEFNKRRSAGLKHYMVMQAHGKITEMCKSIQKVLVGAGVSSSKLEDLPSLDQLQDRSYVHLCHQHQVKDEVWNLADN